MDSPALGLREVLVTLILSIGTATRYEYIIVQRHTVCVHIYYVYTCTMYMLYVLVPSMCMWYCVVYAAALWYVLVRCRCHMYDVRCTSYLVGGGSSYYVLVLCTRYYYVPMYEYIVALLVRCTRYEVHRTSYIVHVCIYGPRTSHTPYVLCTYR